MSDYRLQCAALRALATDPTITRWVIFCRRVKAPAVLPFCLHSSRHGRIFDLPPSSFPQYGTYASHAIPTSSVTIVNGVPTLQ